MMKRVFFGLAALSALAVSPAGVTGTIVHGAPAVLVLRGRGATQSTNWSGYSSYRTGTTFTDVKGTWVQPSASCPNNKKKYSSFWVGIDGYTSSTVEQTGTESDCVGRASYYAWYEFYPNPSVRISMTISPGNTISAEVSASGSSFTVKLTNVTTGSSFTKTQTVSSAQKTSAEWVAEAPSSCFIQCSVLPLANFGTVNFSGSYATGNGHTGSISDASWSNDSITMVTQSGTVKAQPSGLSPDGTAFSVTWKHS
jgi:hypothetical protein